LTTGRLAAAHGWFTGILKMAPVLSPNTCFRGPTGDQIPNSISIGSAVCTAHHRVSLYFTMGHSSPLKIAPSHGDLDSHLIYMFLGPTESSTQTASWSVQPFLQGH